MLALYEAEGLIWDTSAFRKLLGHALVAALSFKLQSSPVAHTQYSKAPCLVTELFTPSRRCSSANSAASHSSGHPLSPHTC